MRTIAQVLDELGNCEFERMEISRIEADLEKELDEIEEAMGYEAAEAAHEAYYKESQ